MIVVPDYHMHLYKRFNGCSLSFVLFNLAPIPVAFGMLDKKFITDLNELSENGVSLLALKATMDATYGNQIMPTWQDFETHGENVWNAAGITDINSSNLLASMIFQGANPWVVWPNENHKGSDSLFSLMCMQKNAKMAEFLSTHPQFPGVAAIEDLRLYVNVSGDYHYYNAKEKSIPLLHYAANNGDMDFMKVLFKLGYNPNVKDDEGRTALYYIKQPDVAKYLVEHKASLKVKDSKGLGLVQHWNKWLSTAAKKAELNALVVENLKESMSLEDLQEFQKPNLINEILVGTKTTFMSLFRKGKFKYNVLFDTEKGLFNLLTVALQRTDEKAAMFGRLFDQSQVSWMHAPWENYPQVSNAMISYALPYSGEYENAQQTITKNYKNTVEGFSEYQNDLLATYEALARNDITVFQVFKAFFLAMNSPHYDEQLKKNNSYHAPVPYEFKSLGKLFDGNYFAGQTLNLIEQENAPQTLVEVIKACFRHSNKIENFRIYDTHATHFLNAIVDKSETSTDWALVLPYIVRLMVAQQWNDKSWGSMLNKLLVVADRNATIYTQEEADILKEVSDDKNICVAPLLASIQKGMILKGIEESPNNSVADPPAPRRKM